MDGHHEHPEHAVRAVDEGEALLLAQLNRGDACCGERGGGCHERAVRVPRAALGDQGERTVRERGEVAGAAEAAVLEYLGRDSRVEHGRVGLGYNRADAGASGGQRGEAQQHECADHLALDLLAGSCRVAEHERTLQLRATLDGNLLRGESAESGRDAVVRVRVVGERVDDGAAFRHLGERVGRDAHACAVAGHSNDFGTGGGADAEFDDGVAVAQVHEIH